MRAGSADPAPRRTTVLVGAGFRPFFLLAGAYGALFPLYWVAVLAGLLGAPEWLAPARWHAHEMVFGFITAAAGGFLLTAVPTWTQTPPLSGGRLAALVGLWLLGRAAMAASAMLSPIWVAAADLPYLPVLTLAVARPIVAARQRRNYGVPVVLSLLTVANLLFHLEAALALRRASDLGLRLAVDLVVLLLVVIGGRIVPAFTENALRREGLDSRVRSRPRLGRLAVAAVVIAVATDVLWPRSAWSGWGAALAAAVLALRMSGWQTMRTLRDPLLWSLHLGYAWVPVGLACIALHDLAGAVPASTGLHALTAGAFGTMILAVMSRVALGHTGRALAAPRAMAAAYLLVTFAALVRTAGPVLRPDLLLPAILASGAVWSGAYVLFVVVYARVLTAPRIDGRPG